MVKKSELNEPATRGDLESVRTELRGEMQGMRTELQGEIRGVKDEIIDLKFDNNELKTAVKELSGLVPGLRDAIMALDERVRYQQDLPERVEQLEQDTHDLKLEVYKLKQAK